MYTQPGVKLLTDFLPTVIAASDLVDCTFVNCDNRGAHLHYLSAKLTGIHLITMVLQNDILLFILCQFKSLCHSNEKQANISITEMKHQTSRNEQRHEKTNVLVFDLV